jgi:hypothetical protein
MSINFFNRDGHMTNDFSAPSFFSRIIRFWWILIGLMIAGGILGYSLTYIIHPQFESEAVITSNLDYANLGKLDDWEEDQTFLAIGDLITSTDVKDAVIAKASTDGISLTRSEVDQAFSADRQDTRWVMRVRDSSAERAQHLNSYWTTAAMDALAAMKAKAESSLVMQQYLNSLAGCLEQSVVVEPSSASCNVENLDAIRDAIAASEKEAGDKDFYSNLIISHTSFELTTSSTLPTAPVMNARGFMVIAGALIGLIAAIILFLFDLPKIKQG